MTESVNQFDKAARWVAHSDPAGLLTWLLASPVHFLGWHDTRTTPLPSAPDRTCDMVAHISSPSDPLTQWAVVWEIQTEPDYDMFARFLEYLGRIRRDVKPSGVGVRYDVGAALINLTKTPKASASCTWPSGTMQTTLQVAEMNLAVQDAQATLDWIEAQQLTPAVLPFIPLMQKGGEPAIIQRWRTLALVEPDTKRRSSYGALAQVFAQLTNHYHAWRKALEDWDVVESEVVMEWKAETLRETLKKLLVSRFGPLSETTSTKIASINDAKRLSELFDKALIIKTPEELGLQ